MSTATSNLPAPSQAAHPDHVVGYGTFIKVWIALLLLTTALVVVSSLGSPILALLGLLVITPTKASLVLLYFMHLKEESTTLKYMVAIAMAVLIIFIFLTFADYFYR
jgi:cytochrome c oxidase subunit IV